MNSHPSQLCTRVHRMAGNEFYPQHREEPELSVKGGGWNLLSITPFLISA